MIDESCPPDGNLKDKVCVSECDVNLFTNRAASAAKAQQRSC